jgi:hypothetical protein
MIQEHGGALRSEVIQEHGGALRSDVYSRLSVGRILANEMPLLPLRSVAARFGMKCYPRIAHLGSRVTLRASVRRHRTAPSAEPNGVRGIGRLQDRLVLQAPGGLSFEPAVFH